MVFSFADLRRLQLGGFADTAALLAAGAGVMATHPVVGPTSWPLAMGLGMGLGAAGGAWLGHRVNHIARAEALGGSPLQINSSRPPDPTPDGVLMGYIVDTGEPLIIPMDDWMRHAMIVGQSGVGKTVLGEWLMFQQIARGGGLLWIDGKLDPDNATSLRRMCAWAGREDDLLIINPGEPESSNSYNPILFGDPDEVSSRCISLIPSTESNAGADFYRQEANQGIATLVNAIQSTGRAYNFLDIAALMSNGAALSWLEQLVPRDTDAQKQMSLFLHRFKTTQRDGTESISTDKLKQQLGGMGGRMYSFGTGKFGKILNTYSPEVRLKEDLLANKIIYVMLPTMGKAEAASNFGKMTIGDFRSSIAQIQALPKHMRPKIPTLSFFDECGSYVTQAWSRIFEQARSARLMMIPAFQTKANLETLGEELRQMVAGNTLTKVFFKPGENDTADWMAEMIGKEYRTVHSITANRGTGATRAAHVSTQPGGWTDSGSMAFSESTELEHKITGSELMKLGRGECIITYDGHNVYHVRIPMIRFDPEIEEYADSIGINRFRTGRVKGLNLNKNLNHWVGQHLQQT